jgi:hypothetical protein
MMKYLAILFLFIPGASNAQIDLGRNKPTLSSEQLTKGPFMRMRDLTLNRDAAGEVNMDWARWSQWQLLKKTETTGIREELWENFGPHGTAGRMISLAFHPTDSNIIYAGSASGGLWRTEDYGHTWVSLTDNYPTMGIGAIAINPQNPNTLLVATGEGYYFGSEFTSGFGILISHDAGATWALTNVTAELIEGFAGMDICWNWDDTTKVCAATSYGICFSSDGGSNFSFTLDRMPARMVQDPLNPAALYLTTRYYTAAYTGGFIALMIRVNHGSHQVRDFLLRITWDMRVLLCIPFSITSSTQMFRKACLTVWDPWKDYFARMILEQRSPKFLPVSIFNAISLLMMMCARVGLPTR